MRGSSSTTAANSLMVARRGSTQWVSSAGDAWARDELKPERRSLGTRWTARPLPGMEYAVPSPGESTSSPAPLVTQAARLWAEQPPSMVDHACCALLFIEMASALQASTAYKTQRANNIVAELQQQDPGAYVPPLLTTSDQGDMTNSRMEELGRHVGANLTEKCVDRGLTLQTGTRKAAHERHSRACQICV